MSNILPDGTKIKKYKICVLDPGQIYQGFSMGMYKSFRDDSKIDLMILISDRLFYSEWYNKLKACGYNVFLQNEFSFEKEKPDVTILTHIYDETLDAYVFSETFWEEEYKPDYYIYDSLLYDRVVNYKKKDLR